MAGRVCTALGLRARHAYLNEQGTMNKGVVCVCGATIFWRSGVCLDKKREFPFTEGGNSLVYLIRLAERDFRWRNVEIRLLALVQCLAGGFAGCGVV